MFSFNDLRRMSRARLHDAQALLDAKRYDGCVYIVGYAIELALKSRVTSKVLRHAGWPEDSADFAIFRGLQSHNLGELLRWSGRETKVKNSYQSEWSFILSRWEPSMRYKRIGSAKEKDALEMIDAVKKLLKVL